MARNMVFLLICALSFATSIYSISNEQLDSTIRDFIEAAVEDSRIISLRSGFKIELSYCSECGSRSHDDHMNVYVDLMRPGYNGFYYVNPIDDRRFIEICANKTFEYENVFVFNDVPNITVHLFCEGRQTTTTTTTSTTTTTTTTSTTTTTTTSTTTPVPTTTSPLPRNRNHVEKPFKQIFEKQIMPFVRMQLKGKKIDTYEMKIYQNIDKEDDRQQIIYSKWNNTLIYYAFDGEDQIAEKWCESDNSTCIFQSYMNDSKFELYIDCIGKMPAYTSHATVYPIPESLDMVRVWAWVVIFAAIASFVIHMVLQVRRNINQ